MVHVIHRIERVSSELIDQYRGLSSATVHEAAGKRGALSHRIKPIAPSMRVCGPAVTVKLRPGDNLMLHKAIYVAQPGDVIVADADGYVEAGAWGEITTLAAQLRGIAGLVFNGAVRDADPIIEMGFPIFCCGLSIKGTEKISLGWINHSLNFDNVTIDPGDLVLGDRDGVVIVKRKEAAEILPKARARDEKENGFKESLRKGKMTLELLGLEAVLKTQGLTEET